jgi:predicted HD superfamily hydrolase involved in NAD metabolism
MGYFDSLQSTGDVAADISAFLTGADRPGTLDHIRAVVAVARRLAADYGVDVEAAAAAAWCHDMAAVVPHGDLLAEAKRWGVTLSESDRAIVPLIHGPLAAAVARQKLGIADADTLHAIRYHSTLRVGASPLEMVVFTADKIALDPTSPRSDFVPVIKSAWQVGQSLPALAFIYLDWVMTNGPALGWTIHADLSAAHAALHPANRTDTDA